MRDKVSNYMLLHVVDLDNHVVVVVEIVILKNYVATKKEQTQQIRYFSFGRHLDELHVTWAHLEKKQTRLQTYTNITRDNVISSWRRRHHYNVTLSQRRPRGRHMIPRWRQRDENPIRTLGDYSKPSHEGYRNTIELPAGNNVVPLQSDTIRLVQNGLSFHGLRYEDPNQHLKDFLKLYGPHIQSSDWLKNRERNACVTFNFSLLGSKLEIGLNIFHALNPSHVGGSFTSPYPCSILSPEGPIKPPHTDSNVPSNIMDNLYPKHGLVARTYSKKSLIMASTFGSKSWALLEDLALYDNESWNNPRDFTKLVKAIALSQDVPSTPDCRLIKLKNQVQHLMEAYLAPTQPTQVNKITTSCEYCSGPHDTQYCMENASLCTDEA
ncbi:hypothetical protein Tco_0399672 [Tanacetum coccineum]